MKWNRSNSIDRQRLGCHYELKHSIHRGVFNAELRIFSLAFKLKDKQVNKNKAKAFSLKQRQRYPDFKFVAKSLPKQTNK